MNSRPIASYLPGNKLLEHTVARRIFNDLGAGYLPPAFEGSFIHVDPYWADRSVWVRVYIDGQLAAESKLPFIDYNNQIDFDSPEFQDLKSQLQVYRMKKRMGVSNKT